MTTEANITITREGGKITSVAVSMPVWTKWDQEGNFMSIRLPLIGFDTVAQNEDDAVSAIEEAIMSFCIVTERFGRGVEKELESLGWKAVANNELLFDINDEDNPVLEHIFRTGENYVNQHLELAA